MIDGIYSKILIFSSIAVTTAGCNPQWMLSPYDDIPENRVLGTVTIALQNGEGADAVPTVTEEVAKATTEKASAFWQARCGIGLSHQGHFVIDAAKAQLPIDVASTAEADRLLTSFYSPSFFTFVFVGGIVLDEDDPDDEVFTAGVGGYPWQVERATLVSSWFLDRHTPAHELGHALGLEHTDEDSWPGNDSQNLMFWLSPPAPDLFAAQCARAKKYLLGHTRFAEKCRPDSPDESLRQYCDGAKVPEIPDPEPRGVGPDPAAIPEGSPPPPRYPRPRVTKPANAMPACGDPEDS